MWNGLQRWYTDENGQDLVEYVLLGGVIALAGLAAMNAIEAAIQAVYTSWDSGTQAIWEPQDPQ